MEELLVAKIGGNVIDSKEALNSFLRDFATIPGHKILVHGGGKLATEMCARLNIPTQMVNGRRVTDTETLKVVTMVYAGWINKTITAKLQANGCKAIGLSGADAALLPAVRRPVTDVDYGWVGDLIATQVNTALLQTLLTDGTAVVVAPITANSDGRLLNVNADTVASVIAEGMSKLYQTTLVYCFEKDGLLRDVNDNNSVVKAIKTGDVNSLKEQGIITDGMLPKIDNAVVAINKGVNKVVIGNAAHIKQLATNQTQHGTHITA